MLPKGWVNADLMDIITLHDSKRIPLNATQRRNNPGNYAYYGANGQVDSVGEYIFDGEYILLAEDGGFFDQPKRGVAYQASGKFWVNNHAHILTPKDEIPHNYLCRALNHFNWMTVVSGTTRLKLTQGNMRQVKVPLPPLAEQRRIVAKLDSLTARIARARAELERVPVLIERYKKNLLKRAFAGELTNKWRLMNGVSEIEMFPLSDVCTSITDGDHQAPPRAKHGVPFITISAMNDGEIDLSKATRFVPSSYLDALKDSRKAKIGDVLFSVTGSIGIPALVKHKCPFVFQRHIAILKPDTKRVSGLFLKLMLQSPDVQVQCAAVATGTAQLTVPLNRLRNFLIPLPTISEQIEVIRLVESTFKRLERMQEDYVDADHLLSKLESSLLAKAFRGELVSQDPTDEPASVLLDRIRAERAAAPKPKRGRKQSIQGIPLPRKQQTEKHG